MVEVYADESTKSKLGIVESDITLQDAVKVMEVANATGTLQATLKDDKLDISQLLID